MPDNLVNCLGLIVLIEVLFYMCRINYDESKTCSRSCAGVKTMITLRVREFDGSPDDHRRFCGNKFEKSRSLPKEARRNSPSGSSQVQEFAGSPQEDHRGFVG